MNEIINKIKILIDQAEIENDFINSKLNVLLFALVWNLFERKCFSLDEFGLSHIEPFVERNITKFSELNCDDCFDFFHARYSNHDRYDGLFRKREKKYSSKVINILNKSNVINYQKITTLLMIAYRLRNNFFHGVKDISCINEQDTMFKKVNLFLLDVIENITKH